MSDESQVSHHATFEAGPPGEIAGHPVQLVYVRAAESVVSEEARFHALRFAIDSEGRWFRKSDEDVDPIDTVLATAERYLTFLRADESTSGAS